MKTLNEPAVLQVTSVAPIPILTYHQIAPTPPKSAAFRSLSVTPRGFARQMAFLHALGYQGLGMGALLPYLKGERQGRVFGITFDDGYLNNLENALPTLQRFGFSSTCYVVSALLGQSNLWDQANGIPPAQLMDASHLRQWMAAAQEVGAHTRYHVRLTDLDAASCTQEILGCKQELEQCTGAPVVHFCYPYGAFTPQHRALVQQAGYQTATTTWRGRCRSGDDLLELPRVPVLRTTSRGLLWWKMASAYEDRRRP